MRVGFHRLLLLGFIVLAGTAAGQDSPTASGTDLPGLVTPVVLGPGRWELGLQLNAFGPPDKVSREGVSFRRGIGRGWEVSVAGTLAKESSLSQSNGADIDFGGSTGEVVFKYRLPGAIDASLEGGVGYSHTPAQLNRPATLLGASIDWALGNRARLYANPKWIILQNNSLAGLSVGATADIVTGLSVFLDGTWMVTGENAISSVDGSRQRDTLYSFGLRFPRVFTGASLDLGYTNEIGETMGFSLTPSYGDVGGLYIGLGYGF